MGNGGEYISTIGSGMGRAIRGHNVDARPLNTTHAQNAFVARGKQKQARPAVEHRTRDPEPWTQAKGLNQRPREADPAGEGDSESGCNKKSDVHPSNHDAFRPAGIQQTSIMIIPDAIHVSQF